MANYISSLTGTQLDDALTQVNQRVPEGWAVGEKDGIPVSSSSPYYQNNAKYYAETAGQTVQQAAQQVVEDATAQAERAEDAANRAEAAVPAGTAGAVFFDRAQSLTDAQQEQARQNIKAGGSNRNLLRNPWWGSAEVINQRGVTGGIMPVAYAIDMWFFTANIAVGTYALGANGITFVSPSGAVQRIQQKFDGGDIFGGKTVTASVMLGDGTIISGTAVRNAGTLQDIFNRDGISTRFLNSGHFEVTIGPGQTKTIRAVKLELGTVSTLANDAPPDYAEELAKCQRYFTRVQATGFGFISVGYGLVANGAIMRFLIPLPTQMIKPTSITCFGNITVVGNGSAYTNSGSLTPLMSLPGGVVAQVTVTSTPTAGHNYNLVLASDAYLDLNADL